jgi:hypothetical protein
MIPAFLNLSNFEVLIFLLLIAIAFLLPVIAIIKVLQNKGLTNTAKFIWILLILFVPYLGAILYLLIGNKRPVQLYQEQIS